MNKRLFWTTAALLTAVGIPLAGHAQQNKTANPSRVNRATSPTVPPTTTQPIDVIKVGEYQSAAKTRGNDRVISTRIQSHEVAGRQAATLYIRNIPVFTFLGSDTVVSDGTKVGAYGDGTVATRGAQTKVATADLQDFGKQPGTGDDTPLRRATLVAAKLNQIWDQVDAGKITVNWQAGGASQAQSDRYLIRVDGKELVEINRKTRLADTTNDLAKDALQAANRLRRLLGNAPPLHEIAGRPILPPKLPREISLGPVRISLSGLASWYGPGSDGSESASGETFNQNALTAAHRSLPFGTKVRVTNLQNGLSVVVRINDRGPYIQGRVIDLSTAAARVLGLMQTGVAPVRVDVIGN